MLAITYEYMFVVFSAKIVFKYMKYFQRNGNFQRDKILGNCPDTSQKEFKIRHIGLIKNKLFLEKFHSSKSTLNF